MCSRRRPKAVEVSPTLITYQSLCVQKENHWEAEKSRPLFSQLPAIAAERKLTKKEAWAKLNL